MKILYFDMEFSFLVKTQAFLRHDGVQGVTKLNKNTCQKGHFIKSKTAGDHIGEREHCAGQLNRSFYIQCSVCSSSIFVLLTVPKGCCGGA